jgi:hypothetical protein
MSKILNITDKIFEILKNGREEKCIITLGLKRDMSIAKSYEILSGKTLTLEQKIDLSNLFLIIYNHGPGRAYDIGIYIDKERIGGCNHIDANSNKEFWIEKYSDDVQKLIVKYHQVGDFFKHKEIRLFEL